MSAQAILLDKVPKVSWWSALALRGWWCSVSSLSEFLEELVVVAAGGSRDGKGNQVGLRIQGEVGGGGAQGTPGSCPPKCGRRGPGPKR